jgi:hypothetical protein
LGKLETISKSDLFQDGLKRAATEFGTEIKQLATQPVETLKGVPEGVGRFFKRVSRGVKTGYQRLGDIQEADPGEGAVISGPGSKLPGGKDKGGPQTPSSATLAAAGMAGQTAVNIFGYDSQRRKIAKYLKIDPYTSNPMLSEKLDEVAWAAFAGGLGFSAVKSLAPASTVVSLAAGSVDWVWDTPRGDLKVQNENTLLELGADQESVDRFMRHPWYTLTQKCRLTRGLAELTDVADRKAVMPLVLSVLSHNQARFVVDSISMLVDYHQSRESINRLAVTGTVWGRSQHGLVVPVPADGLSWNKKLATFARFADFKETSKRLIWVRGPVTPRAREELSALGWTVEDRAGLKGVGINLE